MGSTCILDGMLTICVVWQDLMRHHVARRVAVTNQPPAASAARLWFCQPAFSPTLRAPIILFRGLPCKQEVISVEETFTLMAYYAGPMSASCLLDMDATSNCMHVCRCGAFGKHLTVGACEHDVVF